MVAVTFETQQQPYGAGEYATLPNLPQSLVLPKGYQAALYEKEDFQGNSVLISAHDGEKTFIVSETVCKEPRSMRILENITVIPGHERNALALKEALHDESGWLQDSLKLAPRRVEWMVNDKFGCFVHWGVYAIAGGVWNGKQCGYAEHLQRAMKINQADYKEHFIDKFNPVDFDADEWIQTVKDAGMKYFVITTKHHDGFCMNYSDAYPYDIRMTPFKRDPIAELKAACDKYGLPFGLYYSHAFDWEHPDGAGNDWEYTNGGGDLNLFEGKAGRWFDEYPEMVPRVSKYYVDTKCIPQILELIKQYKPAILWFDTPHKLPPSENLRILRVIREADPSIIINGQLVNNNDFLSLGDYANTGDRAAEIFPTPGVWETIPTTNESYGYSKADRNHKPAEHFIELLIKTAAHGGNVLMNLGPTERGTIEDVDKNILSKIGAWLKENGESIYGTTRSPITVQTYGATTRKGNTLYMHLFTPQEGKIILSNMLTPVKKAYLLTDPDKKSLPNMKLTQYDTELTLPHALPAFTVIAVEFEGELHTGGGRLISSTRPEYLRAFDADYIPSNINHSDGKKYRDFLHDFKNSEQPVIWKLRVHKRTQYKITLHYDRLDDNTTNRYSLAVNGTQHIADVSPDCPVTGMWQQVKPFEASFVADIAGECDLVFRPEGPVTGSFIKLFGITLTPMDDKLEEAIIIEEDTTDTGDKNK